MDIIFAGGKFRAKFKFANIAKISSTRKIGVIQYTEVNGMNISIDILSSNGGLLKRRNLAFRHN